MKIADNCSGICDVVEYNAVAQGRGKGETMNENQDAVMPRPLQQIVQPSYYFLKSLDTFQEGDEYKEYNWSTLWTKVDPLWVGYKKKRFLSYRCKVRRLLNEKKDPFVFYTDAGEAL